MGFCFSIKSAPCIRHFDAYRNGMTVGMRCVRVRAHTAKNRLKMMRKQSEQGRSAHYQVNRMWRERTGQVFSLNDTIRGKLRTVSTGKQWTLLFDANNNGNKHNLNLKLILSDTFNFSSASDFQLPIGFNKFFNSKHKTEYKTNSNRPTCTVLMMLSFLFTI